MNNNIESRPYEERATAFDVGLKALLSTYKLALGIQETGEGGEKEYRIACFDALTLNNEAIVDGERVENEAEKVEGEAIEGEEEGVKDEA